jgi:hypothetical protein
MKKLTLFISLMSFSIFAANEHTPDNGSACGLGWKVADKTSLLASSVRNMTNMTASNTFGMTSGTSGCKRHSIVLNQKKGLYYSVSNFENLKAEMAIGSGEFLNSFASALGCNQNAFAKMVQSHYGAIVERNSSPDKLYENVRALIGPSAIHCQ